MNYTTAEFRTLALEKVERAQAAITQAAEEFEIFRKWLVEVDEEELNRIHNEKDLILVPWEYNKDGEPVIRIDALSELDKMM